MSEGNGGTIQYRIATLERDLEKLEDKWDNAYTDLRAQLAVLQRDTAVFHVEFTTHTLLMIDKFKAVNDRLDQLEASVNDDVKGLRKTLLSVGSAVLIAAITFAITSLAVFGGPG
jgi:hypothetical protein